MYSPLIITQAPPLKHGEFPYFVLSEYMMHRYWVCHLTTIVAKNARIEAVSFRFYTVYCMIVAQMPRISKNAWYII
jgi:hypothetical protein